MNKVNNEWAYLLMGPSVVSVCRCFCTQLIKLGSVGNLEKGIHCYSTRVSRPASGWPNTSAIGETEIGQIRACSELSHVDGRVLDIYTVSVSLFYS